MSGIKSMSAIRMVDMLVERLGTTERDGKTILQVCKRLEKISINRSPRGGISSQYCSKPKQRKNTEMCLTVAAHQVNQGINPGDVTLYCTTNVTSASHMP